MFFNLFFGEYQEAYAAFFRVTIIASTISSFFLFKEMSLFVKRWFVVATVGLVFLVSESYVRSGVPFQHPHVFSKILVIYFIFFIYAFYKRFSGRVSVFQLSALIVTAFALNILFVSDTGLSIFESLMGERAFESESSFLLLIPCVYFFTRYFFSGNLLYFILFLTIAAFIVLLQNRTVWVSLSFAIPVCTFLILRKGRSKIGVNAMLLLTFYGLIVSILVGVYLYTKPNVADFILGNLEAIIDPVNSGTGNMRLMQFEEYWPYMQRNFLFGLRFGGYEMPTLFVDYLSGEVLEEGTVHYFYSFYIDKLFYLGAVGLALFVLPILIFIYRMYKKQPYLDIDQIVLITVSLCGFVLGLTYIWPVYLYAILGYTFFRLEQGPRDSQLGMVDEEQKNLVRPDSTIPKSLTNNISLQ
ncbi:hypothetical protein R9C00_00365 [Flammeovirgaceae bacterium SG7u.111]|nr:hypothetical protein [Flammeovirgaceae bacterium SG7u.132]WPO35907.1 hypothetical protein R9C00_00365 [Flammeovirgaceae bacterium SG7u.111]